MGNADGCVVLLEKLAQGLVDESLGLCVKSTCCFVKDQDVGLLN